MVPGRIFATVMECCVYADMLLNTVLSVRYGVAMTDLYRIEGTNVALKSKDGVSAGFAESETWAGCRGQAAGELE